MKPQDDDENASPTGFFPFSVAFLVLGVLTVGLVVALAVTGWFQHYTDMLIRLSRG